MKSRNSHHTKGNITFPAEPPHKLKLSWEALQIAGFTLSGELLQLLEASIGQDPFVKGAPGRGHDCDPRYLRMHLSLLGFHKTWAM